MAGRPPPLAPPKKTFGGSKKIFKAAINSSLQATRLPHKDQRRGEIDEIESNPTNTNPQAGRKLPVRTPLLVKPSPDEPNKPLRNADHATLSLSPAGSLDAHDGGYDPHPAMMESPFKSNLEQLQKNQRAAQRDSVSLNGKVSGLPKAVDVDTVERSPRKRGREEGTFPDDLDLAPPSPKRAKAQPAPEAPSSPTKLRRVGSTPKPEPTELDVLYFELAENIIRATPAKPLKAVITDLGGSIANNSFKIKVGPETIFSLTGPEFKLLQIGYSTEGESFVKDGRKGTIPLLLWLRNVPFPTINKTLRGLKMNSAAPTSQYAILATRLPPSWSLSKLIAPLGQYSFDLDSLHAPVIIQEMSEIPPDWFDQSHGPKFKFAPSPTPSERRESTSTASRPAAREYTSDTRMAAREKKFASPLPVSKPKLKRSEVVDITDSQLPLSQNPDLVPEGTTPRRPSKDKIYLIYPPENKSVTLYETDLRRLEREGFLNDTIVELYLRYLHGEVATLENRKRFYVFGSYFFENLQIGYHKVQKWTRGEDIFSFDFIIVPVNQALHWNMALICNPGGVGSKHPSSQPYIVMFDSLNSSEGMIPVKLREYLTQEALSKKKQLGPFTDKTIPTLIPNVAHQPNFSDCGVYLLKYAEFLLTNPPGDLPDDPTEASHVIEASAGMEVPSTERANIKGKIQQLKARIDASPTLKVVDIPVLDTSSKPSSAPSSPTKAKAEERDVMEIEDNEATPALPEAEKTEEQAEEKQTSPLRRNDSDLFETVNDEDAGVGQPIPESTGFSEPIALGPSIDLLSSVGDAGDDSVVELTPQGSPVKSWLTYQSTPE